MANKVNRGLVLIVGLVAAMLVATGCVDTSWPDDPDMEVLEPMPDPELVPGLVEVTSIPEGAGPVDLTPRAAPPNKQVLQIEAGGRLLVQRDDVLAQGLSGETTLEFWVWIETMEDQPLVRMGNVSLAIRDRRVRVQLDGAEVESAQVTSREWYHVALVSEADQLRLYVNGHMSGSTQAPTQWTLDHETVTFGGREEFVGAFCGKLDNIRLTNQALYYAQDFTPSQKVVALDNMALAYDFDQQEGTEIEDLSGNERRGKIVGDAALVGGAI